MRIAAPALAALALTAGCVRFGYGSHSRQLDAGVDSGMVSPDGSVSDAGSAANSGRGGAGTAGKVAAGSGGTGGTVAGSGGGGAGSGAMDAGPMRDAAMSDSGTADSGAIDAGVQDAGPRDAGPTDSGAKDAGPQDSGSTDPGTTDPVDPVWTEDCPGEPGVLFCDDFEGGLAKWSYPVHTRGTTAVSTTYKHQGSYSLRASTSASTANSQSQAREGVTVFGHRKSGDLWARYFYYLPSTVTLTQKFSTGVISEYEQPWFGFSVLIFPSAVGIENGGVSRSVNTPFPRNQWVCIEMHVKIDATNGVFEAFMNGTQISSILGNTLPAQGYTSFEVGIHYANFNQGAIDAYTDDVKLGTTRLGCN